MNKKILVVDDDELVLKSISSLLQKFGWSVDVCSDSLSALDKVCNNTYDCLLFDVRMPQLSGPDLLEKIRALEKDNTIESQKVIFLTGYADDDAMVKAFKNKAVNYLHKPFSSDDLIKALENIINTKSFVAENYDAAEPSGEKDFKKIRKNYDKKSLDAKVDFLAKQIREPLKHVKACSYDTENFRGNIENPFGVAQIPLSVVGPILVDGKYAKGEYWVPMATTEGALVLTYDLGARLLSMTGPVQCEMVSSVIHISPMFPIINGEDIKIAKFVDDNYQSIKQVAEADSSHLTLLKIDKQRINNNYVLTFRYDTQDAHGLNMINHASFYACKYIESKTGAKFYHRSHYSGVKHHSLLNEKNGYGRYVKAKGYLSSKALAMLKVSASQMKDFFERCPCGDDEQIPKSRENRTSLKEVFDILKIRIPNLGINFRFAQTF